MRKEFVVVNHFLPLTPVHVHTPRFFPIANIYMYLS